VSEQRLISRNDACERLSGVPTAYVELWQRGDVSVEYYAPRGVDDQHPHDRDEIYIIAAGTGLFRNGDATHPFGPGDFLFVPAHVVHRFEGFSDDFETWVVFFGPKIP
jgi:mannose-6-phosphate isomerase-like protein (cupin superfamily)